MVVAVASAFLFSVGALGCDIIKGKPSIMTDIKEKFGRRVPQSSSQSDSVEYKTIAETSTLKVIAVSPDADLKVLGRQLAREANDKTLLEVDIYDDENEARNYRVRFDPNISPDDAAYEDNWDDLVAIYKKNINNGENYIEIYNDVSHEDVEIIKF
jgi:hypothetical protein